MKSGLTILIFGMGLVFCSTELLAQTSHQNHHQGREPDRYHPRDYRSDYSPKERFVGFRMASRYNESAPKSVLNNEYYPERNTRSPETNQHSQAAPQFYETERTYPPNQSHIDWHPQEPSSNCYNNGYPTEHIPFVTGDIFGVSRLELCDEWEGHCECLLLTSTQNNCECTNPRRAHWGHGSRSCRSGNCGSCSDCESSYHYSRSASGTPISDYFHPRRR